MGSVINHPVYSIAEIRLFGRTNEWNWQKRFIIIFTTALLVHTGWTCEMRLLYRQYIGRNDQN